MLKVKTDELPVSAKQLFIKLYCERNGGINEINLHNAAQSWLSLSISKKQHFIDTISTKYAVDKAQRLIKTEPYLQEKNPPKGGECSKVCEDIGPGHAASVQDDRMECELSGHNDAPSNDNNQPSTHDDDLPSMHSDGMECDDSNNQHPRENIAEEPQPVIEYVTQDNAEECGLQQTQDSDKVQNMQRSLKNVVDEDTDSSNDENVEKEEDVSLPEPVLPPIKTGKDLFELIKAKNGQSHRSYEMLTSREKAFYGHAVLAIKKDYVKKYREFLESLSKKQLFDYYMKILG